MQVTHSTVLVSARRGWRVSELRRVRGERGWSWPGRAVAAAYVRWLIVRPSSVRSRTAKKRRIRFEQFRTDYFGSVANLKSFRINADFPKGS